MNSRTVHSLLHVLVLGNSEMNYQRLTKTAFARQMSRFVIPKSAVVLLLDPSFEKHSSPVLFTCNCYN